MSVYKEFSIEPPSSPESGDVITNVKDIISSGMWANGAGSLSAYYTSSTQSGSNSAHYLDVYAANPATDSTARPQFSVTYGHYKGSGSIGIKGADGTRASATMYRQLSQTLLGPNEDQFTFAGTGPHIKPAYIYAISVSRQQLREKMDPGNWELHLSASGVLFGLPGTFKVIDDSGATANANVNQGGRVFNIISGSISAGVGEVNTAATAQPGGGLGLFYPDLGILIFNGPVLDASASLGTITTSNTEGGNLGKFYGALTSSNPPYFSARREEVITSQHYFCRVPNKEFNFSSNPSFATASDGTMTQSTFYKNPKTFITQVGLYNDDSELLAVAKLSKPLLKSYSREAIVKIKLDF